MSKTFELRNDYFTAIVPHPNELAAAGLAGISLNTIKRWLNDPAEMRRVELDALYAMLVGVAGMSEDEALSLKLGDILAVVGQGD